MKLMQFSFPTAEQYAFFFESAHLLMLNWTRDDAKFLFLIKENEGEHVSLDYPGQTFTNRVLDTVERVFFISLIEDEQDPVRYVLGSYFLIGKTAYGAYYERDAEVPQVVFFRFDGDGPDYTLEALDDDEFLKVSTWFSAEHGSWIQVQNKG